MVQSKPIVDFKQTATYPTLFHVANLLTKKKKTEPVEITLGNVHGCLTKNFELRWMTHEKSVNFYMYNERKKAIVVGTMKSSAFCTQAGYTVLFARINDEMLYNTYDILFMMISHKQTHSFRLKHAGASRGVGIMCTLLHTKLLCMAHLDINSFCNMTKAYKSNSGKFVL